MSRERETESQIERDRDREAERRIGRELRQKYPDMSYTSSEFEGFRGSFFSIRVNYENITMMM